MFTGTATPNLGLPQWEPTDHPDFLTDLNQAFKNIDENAGSTGEEIKDVPKQISDLQTLTQSLNEDSQQMIGEIGAINIALGNLRGETDKIEPIETQVQALEVIARRQSDAIHELQKLNSTVAYSGTLHLSSGDKTFTAGQVRLIGNVMRVLTSDSGLELDANTNYDFSVPEAEATALWAALGLTENRFDLFTAVVKMLFDSTGNFIGNMFVSTITPTSFVIRVQSILGGTVASGGTYPISIVIPKEVTG